MFHVFRAGPGVSPRGFSFATFRREILITIPAAPAAHLQGAVIRAYSLAGHALGLENGFMACWWRARSKTHRRPVVGWKGWRGSSALGDALLRESQHKHAQAKTEHDTSHKLHLLKLDINELFQQSLLKV